MKMQSPSAARNIGPIGDVLAEWLPERGTVLELASGSGEHGLAFAERFPGLDWQPTDPDATARGSIAAWQRDAGLGNFEAPLEIDAAAATWPIDQADAVMAVNMVHISPWEATLGLMAGAARILPVDGPLILYGPYVDADVATAPTNLAFDESLKSRNPAWGLRDLAVVKDEAAKAGLAFQEKRMMPANNLMLLFRKLV